MAGFDSPYVPGWDCHGLPIEIKVDEQLGGRKLELNPLQVRQACREYAQKYIDLQRSQFKRLGVLGRWNDPYSTMNFPYEARIVETFYGFYEKGFVYKGLKPVYWCWHDRTALAEAEVEYEMHTSPSVYVRYKLTSRPEHIDPKLAGREVYTIIWTTTPWTLPASMAVAFNPEMKYVALDDGKHVYIVARELAAATRDACNETGDLKNAVEIASFKGDKLDRVTFAHPFLDREILGVLADYVTTEQGTGAVHTAPSHGPDDFATGIKYDLPLTCNVDAQGKLRNGPPEYDGLFVFKANAPIIRLLEERGALMGRHNLEHKYPHCWRCHNPLIFRATEQWFIRMETPVLSPKEGKNQTTFRQRALDEIKRVAWDPSWGEERISNMIATRPDWCISRQRIWGVPIAVFLCESCHEPLNDAAINKSIVQLFEREGADAWYKYASADLLPKRTSCPNCGGKEFRKEMDIIDVWFESGSSWHAVLEVEPELHFPADLYTEGGDQHRGWFHSSLLCSVGLRDEAPYKMVATSGWTLDEQGRAFSKSLGNGVDPGRCRQPSRRRDRAPLGRLGRLSRGRCRQREPDAARQRKLPQAAQHAALPALEPLRLLSAATRAALQPTAASRPIHPRAHRGARRNHPHRVRRVRVPPRLPGTQRVHQHRPQRAVSRRRQRPPLHAGAGLTRPPQRTDNALAHRRSPHAPHRSHPQLHRRRGLAVSARTRRPRAERTPRPLP